MGSAGLLIIVDNGELSILLKAMVQTSKQPQTVTANGNTIGTAELLWTVVVYTIEGHGSKQLQTVTADGNTIGSAGLLQTVVVYTIEDHGTKQLQTVTAYGNTLLGYYGEQWSIHWRP